MAITSLPDLDSLDTEALKALLIQQHRQLSSNVHEIAHLKLVIEKLRRQIFGAKSEKIAAQLEQLELQLDELEAAQAAYEFADEGIGAEAPVKSRPFRRPLPEHLPREVVTHHPEHSCCPGCGGELHQFGEDVSEQLERVPATFKVIRHVRPKFACSHCERVVEAPAPSRPIERGLAGPALLAHVLVSKYADHQPLYRQSEMYAREGVELDRSTLAGWVGASSELLSPLVSALRDHVLAADKIHGDDTPVPVLAPGNGRTRTGRLWTYVRDDRPAGDATPPAVWFVYSPDRKGEHPRTHLKHFKGALQADAYAGYVASVVMLRTLPEAVSELSMYGDLCNINNRLGRLVAPQDVCSEVQPCSSIFSKVNALWHVIEMRHWQKNALVTSSIVLREDRRLSRLSSSVESFFGLLA